MRRDGVGICQLRCPEEVVWGGVLKRMMLAMVGSRGTIRHALRRPLIALFGWCAQAASDRAEAALKFARSDAERMRTLAEKDAATRRVNAGEPLVEIGDPSSMEAVVDVLSTDAVEITPGLEAQIVVFRGADVLKAPTSALFRSGQDWAVFVGDGRRARKRKVTVGPSNGIAFVVENGLKQGERILVHPGDAIHEGTRVRVR